MTTDMQNIWDINVYNWPLVYLYCTVYHMCDVTELWPVDTTVVSTWLCCVLPGIICSISYSVAWQCEGHGGVIILRGLEMMLTQHRFCCVDVAYAPHDMFMYRLSNDARCTPASTLETLPSCICMWRIIRHKFSQGETSLSASACSTRQCHTFYWLWRNTSHILGSTTFFGDKYSLSQVWMYFDAFLNIVHFLPRCLGCQSKENRQK